MNYKTAAIAGAAACVLSFLAGLIGGVPFFDIILRGLFWGAVGFGGALGVEALLRNLLPELFQPSEGGAPPDEKPVERSVDIVLDDDPSSRGVVEEVDEDDGPRPASGPPFPGASSGQETAQPSSDPGQSEGADEEMPEIGAFLDAFKPASAEDGDQAEGPAPEFGDYAPVERDRGSSEEATFDGEAQDPVELAKAVQTIMKRDA
jgi:hypothetical protein